MAEKTRYSDEELQEFKELILEKLEKAKRDYEVLKASISADRSRKFCFQFVLTQLLGEQ